MNKDIFQTQRGKHIPPTDTENSAGGNAYQFTPEHALIQHAVTGCFNNTFYIKAETQLETVLDITRTVDPKFIAQAAIYARKHGFMKDMPAFLCAVLAMKDVQLLKRVFPKIINNGTMIKKFAHIVRSGVVGRKSFGTSVRNTIRTWLDNRSNEQLFRDSIGGDVTLSDLIKMVRPKPKSPARDALYAYLIGKKYDLTELPSLIREYVLYKDNKNEEVPNVPFQFLTALDLTDNDWKQIARNAPWHMTRMNLNTFSRHGVFKGKGKDSQEIISKIASRLRNEVHIKKARVFPYQLLAAYVMTCDNPNIPQKISLALQDAMEIATQNVPTIEGQIFVFTDVSGSMGQAITGYQKGATSKITCHNVASLMSSIIIRQNPEAVVLPFDYRIFDAKLNPWDSVMTNSKILSNIGGGGTSCSLPLNYINHKQMKGDLCIYISDNESWIDATSSREGSATLRQWEIFKSNNPKAKLVCIDITPKSYSTTPQARPDILNIGGFSDSVFDVINMFLNDQLTPGHLVDIIKQIEI